MAAVLGVEPNYDLATQYAGAFRDKFVYSHAALAPSGGHLSLNVLRGTQVTPSVVHREVQLADVRFVTGVGHGTYDQFLGHAGTVLWDATAVPAKHVRGKIFHFLSCDAGALLGLVFVREGALAFWGYTVPFVFSHRTVVPEDLTTDQKAEIFFRMDSIIDRGILDQRPADEIYRSLVSYFWNVYYQLLTTAPAVAGLFRDNFVHVACPTVSWGDPLATI